MTNLRKAAEMALEVFDGSVLKYATEHAMRLRKACDELHQALAQPEQGPVGWMYVNKDGECEQIEYGPIPFWDDAITLLYTAPPICKWAGLTEEEFSELLYFDGRLDAIEVPLIADLVRAVQAKLKEKNASA